VTTVTLRRTRGHSQRKGGNCTKGRGVLVVPALGFPLKRGVVEISYLKKNVVLPLGGTRGWGNKGKRGGEKGGRLSYSPCKMWRLPQFKNRGPRK